MITNSSLGHMNLSVPFDANRAQAFYISSIVAEARDD